MFAAHLQLFQLREQGATAQGARDEDRMGENIFGWLCCQSWQSNSPISQPGEKLSLLFLGSHHFAGRLLHCLKELHFSLGSKWFT